MLLVVSGLCIVMMTALRASGIRSGRTMPLSYVSRRLSMADTGSFGGYKAAETKREAFTRAREARIRLPTIVLVSPFLDRNIGSVSRAMLNFGMSDLRLVNPQCDHLSEQALAIAAGSREVLEKATVYATLKEAIADMNQVIATTARPRKITQMVYTPWAAAEASVTVGNDKATAVVFGPEQSGLTNEDVALADAVVSIPAFKHFSSLNLAQAVNCLGYEFHKQSVLLSDTAPPDQWLHPKDGERLCRREELNSFLGRLESSLDARGYQTIYEKRQGSHRNIRSIFQRRLLTKTEVDTLQGVLTALLKQPCWPDAGARGGREGGGGTAATSA